MRYDSNDLSTQVWKTRMYPSTPIPRKSKVWWKIGAFTPGRGVSYIRHFSRLLTLLLMRHTRIELVFFPWERSVLPLHQYREKGGCQFMAQFLLLVRNWTPRPKYPCGDLLVQTNVPPHLYIRLYHYPAFN